MAGRSDDAGHGTRALRARRERIKFLRGVVRQCECQGAVPSCLHGIVP
jgi:hypothetical protein